jgi:hypothetical protein
MIAISDDWRASNLVAGAFLKKAVQANAPLQLLEQSVRLPSQRLSHLRPAGRPRAPMPPRY